MIKRNLIKASALLLAGVITCLPSFSALAQEDTAASELPYEELLEEESMDDEETHELITDEDSDDEADDETTNAEDPDEADEPASTDTVSSEPEEETENIEPEDEDEHVIPQDASGIPDAALYNAILAELGGEPLTEESAKSVTILLIHSGYNEQKISSLTGISYLENLEVLDLGNNSFTDMTELKNLLHLKELWLGNSNFTDISGLTSFTNLEKLVLGGNQLTMWKLLTQAPEQFRSDRNWIQETWENQTLRHFSSGNTGLVIESPMSVFPNNTEGQFIHATHTEMEAAGDRRFGKEIKKYELYDIVLTNQPSDYATVHMPVPSDYKTENLGIIAVNADGSYDKLDFLIYEGKAIFQTDHFSEYAVVEFAPSASGNNNNGNSITDTINSDSDDSATVTSTTTSTSKDSSAPQTGDTSSFVWIFALMAASAAAFAVVLKKRKTA